MVEQKKNISLYAGVLLFLGVEILQISGITGNMIDLLIQIAVYAGGVLVAFAAGQLGCRWYNDNCLKRCSLQTAAGFYGLYLLSAIGQFLGESQIFLDDVVTTAFLVSVPQTAENWLFGVGVFLLAVPVIPLVFRMHRKKIWIPVLAVAGLGVTCIPDDYFVYPLFGMFLGTEAYKCMPILAFAGIFFLGMFAEKIKKQWILKGTETGLKKAPKWLQCMLPQMFVLTFAEIAAWYCFCSVRKVHGNLFLVAFVTLLVYALVVLAERLGNKVKAWIDTDSYRKWKRGYTAYIFAYTLGFIVLSVLVFMPLWEEGRTFIWNMDGISQYFPRAVDFSQMVRDSAASLAQGNFHLNTYDFNWGLGDRVVLSFNPFYWCYALFGPDRMELGYQIMTIVRFYLTGLSASALFLYLKKGRLASMLGSYAYVFCGYALHLCLYHPQFSYALMLLPIMIIAVEEILREKRWYLGTITVGISLMWSYYFLYINTIALVVYFLVRFFCMEKTKRTLQKFVQYVLTFAWAFGLGVGIGFVGLTTSFSSYAGSARTGSSGMATASGGYYWRNWIIDILQGLVNTGKNPAYSLRLGFVALAWVAIVILFLRWRQRKEKCILVILSFVAFCMPVVSYMWNGFAYIAGRWTYVIALLISALIADAVMDIRSLTKKELRVLFYVTCPLLMLCLFYSGYNNFNTAKAMAALMVAILVVVFSAKSVGVFSYRGMQIALCVLMAFSLLVNSNVYFTENGLDNSKQFAKTGTAYRKATNSGIQAVDTDDEEFYRVGTTKSNVTNLSGSLIENVNGLTYYNSTYNKRIYEFMSSLGVTGFNKVMFDGFDNRGFLNALACVKYYVTQAGEEENAVPYGYYCVEKVEEKYRKKDGQEDYLVFQTDSALPLGYTYDHTISPEEFDQYSAMEKQELLMTHAVVEDAEPIDTQDIQLTGTQAEIRDIQMDGVTYEDGVVSFDPGSKVTIAFNGMENAETYVYFTGHVKAPVSGTGSVHVEVSDGISSDSTDIWSQGDRYDTEQEYYILNVGYHEDVLDKVTITFSSSGKLYPDEWGIYLQPMDNYDAYINALRNNSLEDVTADHNQVSGKITLDEDKLLVLSIPYEKGWTALVDGEKTELFCANLMYTGLNLKAGEHTVELRYSRPGLKKGLLVSAACLLLFVIIVVVPKRKGIKRSEHIR